MKHTSRVKLVACDLDGTLLGPGGTGLDTAKAVANLCASLNVKFTLATGRVFGSVEKYLRYLGIEGPVITNGGAMVAAVDREPVLEKHIDTALARAIATELRLHSLPFYFSVGKEMLTEWKGRETAEYSRSISFEIKVVRSLASQAPSPNQVVARVPAEEADWLAAHFRDSLVSKVCVIKSLPHLIEFQALGVSKASALEYLAKSEGVSRNEVLAIGDGLNDLDMLAWAGSSACVGNASPEVRSAVDLVANGLYAEGVMEVIKKTLVDQR